MNNFEYPIYPDRTYRFDMEDQKYYITGENLMILIASALDKAVEE
jgi:hypothetical protein